MAWAINCLTCKHEDLSLLFSIKAHTVAHTVTHTYNSNGQMAWVTLTVPSQWVLSQTTRRTVPKEWHLCLTSSPTCMCPHMHTGKHTHVQTSPNRRTWHTVQKNVYSDQDIITKILELLKYFPQVLGSSFRGLDLHICKKESRKREFLSCFRNDNDVC